MAWDRNTSNLRDVLAGLYWDRADTVRFLREVGIPLYRVDLNGKMINVWMGIVEYAIHQEMLDELIAQARKEFPRNKLLLMAEERRLLAVQAAPLEDGRWRGATDEAELEVLTKGINTLRPISFLQRGVEVAKSVARVVLPNGESGTGFLIKDNLLLTNAHVLPNASVASSAQVEFNYQETLDGLNAQVTRYALLPNELFVTSPRESQGGDDWTVVRVAGDANSIWGKLPLQRAQPQKKDEVIIIQHPGGGPKQIALSHNIVAYAGPRRVQYLTDTQKGSSGSPVFDLNWQIVALHHAGGLIREPGTGNAYYRNQGIHVNVILDGLLEKGLL